MRSRILRWIVPPLILVLLVTVFTLRPSREEQTVAWFERDRARLAEIAQQVVEQGSAWNVEAPAPWLGINFYDQGIHTVEFSMGGSGMGSENTYWGINFVPSDSMVGYQGQCWDYWKAEGDGRLYYEPEGDNTCYVKQLDTCWYYYEMSF